MDGLAQSLCATVLLSSVTDYRVQHIGVTHGGRPTSDVIGGTESLLHETPGKVLLSGYAHMEVRKIIHRLNSEEFVTSRIVNAGDVIDELALIKARGWASGPRVGGALGVMSMPLPQASDSEKLALSVVAESGAIEQRSEAFLKGLFAARSAITLNKQSGIDGSRRQPIDRPRTDSLQRSHSQNSPHCSTLTV